MRIIIIVLSLILVDCVLSLEEDVQNYVKEFFVYRDAVQFVKDCGYEDVSLCLKEQALRYLDNLPGDMDLGGGFRVKKIDDVIFDNRSSISSLPEEPRAREQALDSVLMERVVDYISTHSIELRLTNGAAAEVDKEVEEGRKKKGGNGEGMKMKTMMMMLQLKAAIVGAFILKFIGLVAFKALMLAKVALTIASMVALKKIVEQKHHSSTYEVVAHPYDDHSHFDRSFNQELAYKGYGVGQNNN